MSYYYDGNVYTCDEGRMMGESGDNTFLLGNVHTDSYDDMVGRKTCKATCAASVVESLPSCCDCAYHPYCGVCPVVAYSSSGDIFPTEPFDFRCKVYRGIQDILFRLLQEDDNQQIIDRITAAVTNTIPIWRTQVVLSLNIERFRTEISLQETVACISSGKSA